MNAKRRKLQESSLKTTHDLPEEVWGDILHLLDFKSVFNFSSCCHYFRDVTSATLQNANLLRLEVSKEVFGLLKDSANHILVLNLSHASSLQAEDLLECLSTMKNLVSLDISRTGLTIPSFVSIAQHLSRLQNLTIDLSYSEENRQPKMMESAVLNQYKSAFSKLKFIHFHAQDWILYHAFWENSLSILEEAVELFELRLTLYHEMYEFRNIQNKSGTTPKLAFKKLTITTVTYFQDEIYYENDIEFIEKFINCNWEYVLCRTSENTHNRVTMSQNLFYNLKMHYNPMIYGVSFYNNMPSYCFEKPCVLHMWHPSLFESNCDLGKEIVKEIEQKMPKKVIGNITSILGLHLNITAEVWKEAEKECITSATSKSYLSHENIAIAENITLNVNSHILKNITTFIFSHSNMGRDDFFHKLFLKCPKLDTLILKNFFSARMIHFACKYIKFAQNIKMIQVSAYAIDFKRWLSQLINCKKIENVAFHCEALNLLNVCKADFNNLFNQSENLKCLFVQFQNHSVQYNSGSIDFKTSKALEEFFESAVKMYKHKSLTLAVMRVRPEYSCVDTQLEVFYPIFSKFLKPLQNLNVKYEQ